MLSSLRIENFAIVSTLELDFSKGMTAFTGETGAGKSIMIDALMLALGGRADASIIRAGEEKCDIQACFHFAAGSAPAQWLSDHDIAFSEHEIFLRRILYAEGRSKSSINGFPFPLQKIKELSALLVDIHGQHQHQTLLNHATHRQQLDHYANHPQLLLEVANLHRQCQQLTQELDALEALGSTRERAELLQYQIDELTKLNLQEGEIHTLHNEHQLLHHAKEYLENVQQITTLLNADDTPNILQSLHQIIQRLGSLPQEQSHIKTSNELINSALIQCEEAADELEKFARCIPLDPERLYQVEERMSLLHQAARKYHIDVNSLPNHLLHLQTELQQLAESKNKQHDLQILLNQQRQAYEDAALKLRHSRQQAAQKLAAEISLTIRQLGMPKGFIEVEITPSDRQQAHGLDRVEYKVCTNPGMPTDSLSKVASGGELSRISLAIQMIAAQRGATPTLLFDEVDVGIGGATAALVGQLLRKLGERIQLFCVTHQPQVASCAHQHFIVEKSTEHDQTFCRVSSLIGNEKIDEIARMLGGLKITPQIRASAEELLAQSQ